MKGKFIFWCLVLLSFSIVNAQTQAERQQITSEYDKNKIEQLAEEFAKATEIEKQKAIEIATKKGWPVIVTNPDGSQDELMGVTKDGYALYYTINNVDAAVSTRANFLHTGGGIGLSLDGQNMTAYVWDGGPTRPTHQEFDGPGGNNRVTINDGVTGLNGNSFHAMHVTGTIVASGVQANAKGMAWQANALTHNWTADLTEATTEAGNGMLISNHSYGYKSVNVPDQFFGAYIQKSRDWDNLMFNTPNYLMVVAAGNDGNTNHNAQPLDGNSAYDKLTGHATAKNSLTVANAQDANIDASGNLVSVSINSSSSEGPTDDYRIKPDITGNGTSLYSTYDASDTDYNTISGTSMASPNVSGTLLLLQQHANNVNGSYMTAATLKGLALHTADDVGPNGPDAVYGWGLLNGKRAAETISQHGNGSIINELTLSSGQSYQITVTSDGINDLLASISWTDRPGTVVTATNSNTPVLINDLDIRVTKGVTTYEPWKLTGVNTNTTGDNIVDPYERVEVANASGTYTITVTHKGSLTGGSQNFSLIVTGLTSITMSGPDEICIGDTATYSLSGVPNGATIVWSYTYILSGQGTTQVVIGAFTGNPTITISATITHNGNSTVVQKIVDILPDENPVTPSIILSPNSPTNLTCCGQTYNFEHTKCNLNCDNIEWEYTVYYSDPLDTYGFNYFGNTAIIGVTKNTYSPFIVNAKARNIPVQCGDPSGWSSGITKYYGTVSSKYTNTEDINKLNDFIPLHEFFAQDDQTLFVEKVDLFEWLGVKYEGRGLKNGEVDHILNLINQKASFTDVTVALYTMTGYEVMKEVNSEDKFSYNLSKLSPGIYFIKYSYGNFTATRKIAIK